MMRLVCKWLLLATVVIGCLLSCRLLDNGNVPKSEATHIVITFDDQHESIYQIAVPLMKEAGIRATNFVNTGYVGRKGRLSWEQVEELEFEYGWETGGHTLHHIYLPEATDQEAEYEIAQDWLNLHERGLSCESFALPRGAAIRRDYQIISRYYKNIRNSQNIRMFKPIDRLNIGYFAVRNYHTGKEIIGRIEDGLVNKESLVVIGFHRFDEPEHTHNCNQETFAQVIDYLKNSGLEVITLKEAEHLFR